MTGTTAQSEGIKQERAESWDGVRTSWLMAWRTERGPRRNKNWIFFKPEENAEEPGWSLSGNETHGREGGPASPGRGLGSRCPWPWRKMLR